MPVLSLGHSKFWRARANIPAPPAPFGTGGYPAWQSSNQYAGSLLGALQMYWDKCAYAWLWFKWAWNNRLTADQQRAINEAITVVRHPAWASAQRAVFATSRVEGARDYTVWNRVSNSIAGEFGTAENLWRHTHAMVELRAMYPEMDNPTRHLLVELAYHEFAASGRGKPTMDR